MIGARRHRLTIQRETQSEDDAGQPVRTWTDIFRDVPASFKVVGAGETDQLGKKKPFKNLQIQTPYFDGVTNKDRLVINENYDEIFGITSVYDEEGLRRELTITASLEVI